MGKTTEGILIGLFFLAVGCWSFCGAYWRWEIFVRSRKVRQLEDLIGVERARWFHVVLGIGILCLGVVVLVVVVAKG